MLFGNLIIKRGIEIPLPTITPKHFVCPKPGHRVPSAVVVIRFVFNVFR